MCHRQEESEVASPGAVHASRSPVYTSCTFLSLLAPQAGGDHSHSSGAPSCSSSGLGPRGCPSPHYTCCSIPTHARSAHCLVHLFRCCPRLSLCADTGSKPGQEEEQHVVSACYDPSLRLCRCHSTAQHQCCQAAPPAGKALQSTLEFHFFIFSLLSSSPCPCTAKTEETTADSKGLSCPALDCL